MLGLSSIFQHFSLGEAFQKQVIKSLLQKYVGQFLEEELSVDQLTVEIISGTGIIKHLTLNVNAVNERADQLNLPFKFVEGYIGEICLSVPWKSLVSANSFVEVTGVVLTLHAKQRAEDVSLVDSMINSMSTSMQIAHECLSQVEAQTSDNLDKSGVYNASEEVTSSSDTSGLSLGLEALESFAQAIDTVLNRTKVRFIDTVIRLEYAPKTGLSGVALEIKINKIDYFDEAGLDKDISNEKKEFGLHNKQTHPSESFTSKKFLVEGITLYTDEYSSKGKSSNCNLDSSIPIDVHQTNSKFNNFINTSIDLTCNNEESDIRYLDNLIAGTFNLPNYNSNPILCARLYGCQEIKLRLRQNDSFYGPKVQIEGNCGSLMVFISPRQVHLISEFLDGFVFPEDIDKDKKYKSKININRESKSNQKPMDQQDFRKVEHELLKHLSPSNKTCSDALGHGLGHGWSSPPDVFNDDEFLPVNPILDQPLGLGYHKNKLNQMSSSIRSEVVELDTSFTSTLSGHPATSTPSSKNLKTENEIHMSFKIRLNSLGIVVLHDDILLPSSEGDESMASNSIVEMQGKTKEFFSCVGNIWHSENSYKEFIDLKEKLHGACSLSHIRIISCPITIDGTEKSWLNKWERNTGLTVGWCEIIENIYEGESNQIISTLLSFKKVEPQIQCQFSLPLKPKAQISVTESQNITIAGKLRRQSIPKIEVKVTLDKCSWEIDLSIIDRVSSLLNKQTIIHRKDQIFSPDLPPSHLDNQKFLKGIIEEDNLKPESKFSMLISCSSLNLKLYIPIPDLRPLSEMDRMPWWKRNVRKETILFTFEDFQLETSSNPSVKFDTYEIRCSDMHLQFQLQEDGPPISLARASVSHGTEKGFDPVRIVCDIYPALSLNNLEDNVPIKENLMSKSMMGFLDFAQDGVTSLFGKWKIASQQREKLIEVTIPAKKEERNRFVDNGLENVRFKVDLHMPDLQFVLPSKHIYELLYNRIISDLLLWAPSAPNHINKPHLTNITDICFDSDISARNFQQFATFKVCNSFQNDHEAPSSDFPSLSQQSEFENPVEADEPLNGQTLISVSIHIGNVVGSIKTPYRDAEGKIIPDRHGELMVTAKDSYIFTSAGHKGNKDLCYTCITANKVYVYHRANELSHCNDFILSSANPLSPKTHSLVLYPCDNLNKMEGGANPEYANSDSLVVCIETNFDLLKNEKVFILAGGLSYATLRHYMSTPSEHWSSQLSDVFNVEDYPIEGYVLPDVVTEINFHFENCSIDYRPLNLPVKSFITVDSLSISSNLTLLGDSSVLLIFIEDAGMFLSQNLSTKKVFLKSDYVCIATIGVLEICMKVQEDRCGTGIPSQEFNMSNNNIHIRTCADSCKLFMELLIYLANEGDLVKEVDFKTVSENSNKKVIIHPSESKESIYSPTLGRTSEISEMNFLENMIQDAMIERGPDKINPACSSPKLNSIKKGVDVFFFPDENTKNSRKHPLKEKVPSGLGTNFKSKILHESFVSDTELALKEASQNFIMEDEDIADEDGDDEFCILDKIPGSGIKLPSGKPNFKTCLGQGKLALIDNNFFDNTFSRDKKAKGIHSFFSDVAKNSLPIPTMRYNLLELSIVWHIYGGCDFPSTYCGSINDKNGNKHSYQNISNPHYESHYSSKQRAKGSAVSFTNGEATIHSNKIEKSPLSVPVPPRHNANMKWYAVGGPGRKHDILMEFQLSKVRFKYDIYPNNSKILSRHILTINDIEIRDRLSSSKINKFLYQFSSESCPRQAQANMFHLKAVTTKNDSLSISPETVLRVSLRPIKLNIDQDALIFLIQFFGSLISVDKDSIIGEEETPYCPKTPLPTPVITVNVKKNILTKNANNKNFIERRELNVEIKERNDGPSSVYFKSFVFSPDVPIRIDYQGKHVDINSQYGAIAGLVIGLGQLNHSEIMLKRVEFLNGVLGVNKLISSVTNEWLTDIRKNQLPSILGGVGPMHSFVKLFGGLKDLVWLPIEQYHKDGRVLRGLQRGTSAFTTSSAYAVLDLSGRFVGCIQSAAETMYDMVSSGPSVRNKSYKKQNRQPQDIREGVTTAYGLVRNGLGDTANTIWKVASEEHSLKGMSGAVGGVLRQIPPTVVQPIILASEATCTVIGGMTNQLVPDARKEAAEKWKS